MSSLVSSDSTPRPRRRMLVRVLVGIVAYLLVGQLFHRFLLPSTPADPATFPRAGDTFKSVVGGNTMKVVAIRDGKAMLEVTLEPHATGPPLHTHRGFDEHFHVTHGTMSIQLPDGTKELGPGDSLIVPAGVPHQPFNATSEPVLAKSTNPGMPVSFAACLVQIYALLETNPSGLTMAAQFSVFDPICDTQLAEPPSAVLAATNFAIAPTARLLGFKSYDRSVSLHP